MKQKNKSMMIKEILNFEIENLHQEIKLDIISRLPVESVLNCRLVCKTWRDLIRFPYFADMHLRHQLMRLEYRNHSHDSPTPLADAAASDDNLGFLLLTMDGSRPIFYLEYDEYEKHYKKVRRINHPSLVKQCNRSALVGSCNGLVCLSIRYDICDPSYICNFITNEYLILPRCNLRDEGIDFDKLSRYEPIRMVGGFGYNHSTNEYKVVRIIYYNTVDEPIIGRVKVYTLGDGNGRRKKGEITYKLIPHIPKGLRGILANGALHWLDYKDWRIVVFDLETEEFSLLPSPPCFHPGEFNYFQLQVLGECLCVTTLEESYESLKVWSFKKNICGWESMFSIHIPDDRIRLAEDIYWPLALTMRGEVLLRWGSFLRYNPKTETIDELVEGTEILGTDLQLLEAIPHMNSFVSLRALGEIPQRIR